MDAGVDDVVVPGAGARADRLAVEHQAARLLTAYRAAWLTARVRQRLAILRVTGDTLAIRTVSGAGAVDTLLTWLEPGPAAAGVALQSPPHTTVFGPDGIAMGLANARHVFGVERDLGLDIEASVQRAMHGTVWMSAMDWVYLAAQALVFPLAVVLVYRLSRPVYRVLRNALLGGWILALPVYALSTPEVVAGKGTWSD